MRKMLSMLLMILIIAAIAPFALPLKNGEPLLKWSDISIPQLPTIPKLPGLNSENPEELTPVITYKWQDADGHWHLGDTPPANYVYEIITVDPSANLIQPVPAASKSTTAPTAKINTEQPSYSPATAYNPEKVTEIMDSARNVSKILQQRKEQQDQLLQDIE